MKINPHFFFSMFSSKNLLQDYVFQKTLGIGSFAKVKLATHIPTNCEVAIKIMKQDLIAQNKKNQERLKREIQILKSLQHQHVIQLFEIIETKKKIYLVMEYVKGGELLELIQKKGKIQEHEARKIIIQVASGLSYCHQMGIVHRDIKPENLLLDGDGNVVIIDFGLSNFFQKDELFKTACGSPIYSPPEILLGEEYPGEKVDIWSMGIVLYTLVCGKSPFAGENIRAVCDNILHQKVQFPSFISRELEDLLTQILEKNPVLRATMPEILSHPWIQYEKELCNFEFKQNNCNSQEMDDPVISSQLSQMGVSLKSVKESLHEQKFDSAMAKYLIVKKNKKKLQRRLKRKACENSTTINTSSQQEKDKDPNNKKVTSESFQDEEYKRNRITTTNSKQRNYLFECLIPKIITISKCSSKPFDEIIKEIRKKTEEISLRYTQNSISSFQCENDLVKFDIQISKIVCDNNFYLIQFIQKEGNFIEFEKIWKELFFCLEI
ncbi:protein kinase [Anaeramoeba ignava]|uniref:non-specific serine/threonine protein kinase n=1 Tax=Anaeramoeba ignava TaxID=1746090 RepID=A0A9Q0LNJ3_ANAIG|nr:protein kinase [Anaeramoeba ignava]